MFDIFPTQPVFSVTVTGGSMEENNQMTTAIFHAMQMCGFVNTSIDGMNSLTPGNQSSYEVLNAIRALNPDLFETHMVVNGVCEHDQMIATQSNAPYYQGQPLW